MRRVICVWFPEWPLQRRWNAQRERSSSHNTADPGTAAARDGTADPLILYGPGRRGFQVWACSRAARRCGVAPGMPLAEAEQLAAWRSSASASSGKPFPGPSPPVFLPHTPEADRRALRQLAELCQPFSPRVGLEEAPFPECLLLDVSGCAALFDGERRLLAALQTCLRERGWQTHAALADTVGAAWAAAHFPAVFARWNTPSKPARDRSAGSSILLPAGTIPADVLAALPPAALRLRDSVLRTLGELDIGDVARLLRLSRRGILSRFGADTLQRLDQLLGEVPEEMVPVVARPMDFVEHDFECAETRRNVVQRVLQQLTERLLESLGLRQQGVLRLEIQLRGESPPASSDRAPPVSSFRVGMVEPSRDAARVWLVVRQHWERISLPEAVAGLRLHALETAPLVVQQGSLFDSPAARKEQQQFRRLLERLSSRLGEGAVLRVGPCPDAQPERAFRCEPGVSPAGLPAPSPAGGHGPDWTDLATARPLQLEANPIPISVLVSVTDGPPLRFHAGNRDYVIARSWGPERLQTGWWRTPSLARDYYRVETRDGQQFWVYRRHASRDDGPTPWYLHGTFF